VQAMFSLVHPAQSFSKIPSGAIVKVHAFRILNIAKHVLARSTSKRSVPDLLFRSKLHNRMSDGKYPERKPSNPTGSRVLVDGLRLGFPALVQRQVSTSRHSSAGIVRQSDPLAQAISAASDPSI
jgi:hypothetical protein